MSTACVEAEWRHRDSNPAMDAYFEDLHLLWSGHQPPEQEQERELMSRYDLSPA